LLQNTNGGSQSEISTIFHQPITRDSIGNFRERPLDISLVVHPLANGKHSCVINPVIYSIKSQAKNSSADSIFSEDLSSQRTKSEPLKSDNRLKASSSYSEIRAAGSVVEKDGTQARPPSDSSRPNRYSANDSSARHQLDPKTFTVYKRGEVGSRES
jgi:hypothetical protein